MRLSLPLAARRGGGRSARGTVALPALGGIAIALAWAIGVRVNWTESMPRGLYRQTAPHLERGALVIVCLEGAAARVGRERGYLPRGNCPSGVMPVVKEIVALPGDRLRIDRSGIAINGRPVPGTSLLTHDTSGRPLSHTLVGERRLAEDEFFVLGRASPRSWDSRYFGAVAARQIGSAVTPWLTVESDTSCSRWAPTPPL